MVKNKFLKISTVRFVTIVTAVLVCLIVLPLSIAYAWFESTKNIPFENTPVTPPKIEIVAWFENNDNGVMDDSEKIADTSFIEVNLIDSTKETYYAKLRVNAVVSGNIDVAMRVSVTHLWKQGSNMPSRASIKYTTDNNYIIDNSAADSFYYYCNTATYTADAGLAPYTIIPKADLTPQVFNIINGMGAPIRYEESLSLILLIQGEMVQANRAVAFWGSLPTP